MLRAQLGIFFYPVGIVRSHYKAQTLWSKMVVPVTPRYCTPVWLCPVRQLWKESGLIALFVKVKGCAPKVKDLSPSGNLVEIWWVKGHLIKNKHLPKRQEWFVRWGWIILKGERYAFVVKGNFPELATGKSCRFLGFVEFRVRLDSGFVLDVEEDDSLFFSIENVSKVLKSLYQFISDIKLQSQQKMWQHIKLVRSNLVTEVFSSNFPPETCLAQVHRKFEIRQNTHFRSDPNWMISLSKPSAFGDEFFFYSTELMASFVKQCVWGENNL